MTSDRQPKVMVVVTAAVTARLFMRGYVEFLASSGYEVILVADDVSEIADALAERGVVARSLPMRRDPALLADLRSLGRMLKLMHQVRPDAVIYATPKASLISSIAARMLRIPVRIYELWGIRFETAKGVSRQVFRRIERLVASSSTAIVANSASLARQAVALGITAADNISVPASGSSHGVDTVRFDPAASFPPVDSATARFLSLNPGMTIGYVGRLHPDKGVDVLLEAAERVRAAGEAVRVLLVGGDEGVALPEHPELAVHRTGDVDDVRPYLAEFDVLVLMSLREGFPNVVLEAAAMEVPAIVSDATGCVDSVLPGATGVVIPAGDVAGVAEAIQHFAAHPDDASTMGSAARGRASAEYSPDRVWSAKLDILGRSADLGIPRPGTSHPGYS